MTTQELIYKKSLEEYRVKEVEGIVNNPRILEYHSATSLEAKDDETSWCSSFVNWCCKQVGVKGTGSAVARSWLKWGNKVVTPYLGCIVVLKRGNHAWQGHVGFYAGKERENHILVYGGNQKNKVCYLWLKKENVIGYREINEVHFE
jgi:uncharacterized protein (TIGR02594 family)